MSNKLIFLLLMILILATSCQKSQENINTKILGSWSFCDSNGDYNEVHFMSEYLIHSMYFNPTGWKYNYIIKEDSLLYYNLEEIVETNIFFQDNDHITQTVLNKNTGESTIYQLNRINYSVNVPDLVGGDSVVFNKELVFFRLLFERREENFGCKSNIAGKNPNDNMDTTFIDPF